MELSADLGPHRSAFLDLEYAASAAYNDFVYADRADADAVRGFLFDKGVAEFSATQSHLLVDQGQVLGMISCLPAEALAKCRMRSAYALERSGILKGRSDFRERLELASRTLLRLRPGDFYLSRIAVAPNAGGKGHGARLIRHCEDEAAQAGAYRICLEVSKENPSAIAFYRRHGFTSSGSQAVADRATARALEYAHMIKDVSRE